MGERQGAKARGIGDGSHVGDWETWYVGPFRWAWCAVVSKRGFTLRTTVRNGECFTARGAIRRARRESDKAKRIEGMLDG